MSLTGKDVAEIARLLDQSHFSALDLKMGDFRLRIRRDGGCRGWVRGEAEPESEARDPAQAGISGKPAHGPRLRGDSPLAENEVDVPAPLLGNFYAAPRPGEDPFVKVGDRVSPDTVIGIIEVMKLMNSVRAGISGTVSALLAENGSAIEKGQAIIRVKVD